jgi:hypothetical protein
MVADLWRLRQVTAQQVSQAAGSAKWQSSKEVDLRQISKARGTHTLAEEGLHRPSQMREFSSDTDGLLQAESDSLLEWTLLQIRK